RGAGFRRPAHVAVARGRGGPEADPRLLARRRCALGAIMSQATDGGRWVRVSREEPGVAVVQMCAAEERNALSEGMATALAAAFASAAHDPEMKVLVLLGLPDVFCSGAPREFLRDLAAHKVAPTDLVLSRAVLDVPVPVIAAMEGHATGGGLAL